MKPRGKKTPSQKQAPPAPKPLAKAKKKNRNGGEQSGKGPPWNLRLYVAGQSPKSLAAFSNLKKLCDTYLTNQYLIEVVDLSKHPQLAQNDQIVALPTLVRKLPEPIKRIIGDLANLERVMVGMEISIVKE